jgi:Caspase domain
MKRIIIVACAVLVAVQCTRAERFALLVGNSVASGNYAQLKYVQNDIMSFREILSGFCGFDKQHIVTLYNGTPEDLDRSLRAVTDMMAAAGGTKDNMFLFYYSGHADQTSLKMGDNDYPMTALKQKFTDFPSDIRIGIFDACQSGSFTRIKGGTLSEPFLFKDDGKTKGQVILCSSSINENAQESDALENSVFTFHFVNALRGSGDITGDGRVTLSEAYQYSYNHTLSSTAGSSGGIQHPSYQFKIQGEGDIVLADLNVSSQGILLPPGTSGDITILSVNNIVVADLTKEKSSAVMIALVPGTYRLINGRTDVRYQATATVTENAIVKVGQDRFAAVETGQGRKKGLDWQRSLQIGVTLSGGYGRFDLSSLSWGLDRRFDAYNDFSMSPGFSFLKDKPLYQVAAEVIVRDRFIGTVGYGTFGAWSSSADYAGSRTGQFDNSSYATRLHTEYSVNVSEIDLGAGYRFQQRFLRNISLLIGVSVFDVTLNVKSAYQDSLYDVLSTSNSTDQGFLYVPFLALGYCRPLTKWCDVGAKIRYRYQKSSRTLESNGLSGPSVSQDNGAPLTYNFGGFDGNLFVNFHIRIVRSE